jgi:Na+/H+ antiporter NhaD/arsenite permease-like protein
MSCLWDVPFAGLLLTTATGPLLFPKFWHAHYGKLAFGWAAAVALALAAVYGPSTAFEALVHALVAEYMSFIMLTL